MGDSATMTLPKRITLRELARELGLTPQSVSAGVARGEIPEPRRVGRLVFWTEADLEPLFGARSTTGQGGRTGVG